VVLALLGLERVVFGTNPLPYHLLGLVLHAAASVLAWRVLQRLGFGAAALGAGLLFAVHPIHAEAVLAAYGQADLLVGLFVLGALERYVAFARTGARGALATSYGLFLLGLGCKETAAVLPALAVLTRGLLLRPEQKGVGRWVSAAELGYALPFLAYLGARAAVLGRLIPPSEVTVSHGFPFWLRVKTVAVSLAHDVRLVVLPWAQTIHHGPLQRRLAGPALAEAVWLALTFVGLSLAARVSPPGRVAWAAGWFFVTVAPVAGIVPIPVLVSERNLYLPALAPALLVVLLLEAASRRAGPVAPRAVLAGLVVAGLAASAHVARTWRTSESLWEAVVARAPDDADGWIWLAGAHFQDVRLPDAGGGGPEGRDALARARTAYDRALALDPRRADARAGRAAVALVEGDCRRALELSRRIEEDGPAPWLRAQLEACRSASRNP
jgi:hypothetical protein